MNIQVARTTSEKLPESSNDKFLPSTNELRLTIKCGRKKKERFIYKKINGSDATHSLSMKCRRPWVPAAVLSITRWKNKQIDQTSCLGEGEGNKTSHSWKDKKRESAGFSV